MKYTKLLLLICYFLIIYVSIRKGRKKKGMEQREKETERMLLAIEVVES